ncbi:jg5017 [Pararge aegeria aegeria]|uniref:Jg5017 protein n=1 Tax=Pararge aegeria aegeria TaxID=348720 RepID=A0A8S4RFB3_9NEOP|nr:jg5017 [Pararge aegeria aegeria]
MRKSCDELVVSANFGRPSKRKKVAYLGHVLRQDRYRLLQLIMMGKVAGKKRIGRKKKSWLRNIREWTGIASGAQLFSLAIENKNYQKLLERHLKKKKFY